ncbi:MAG: nickel pincer cofactor biosynthesis protein LarC, partial [Planctomycetaceae bacterium]
MRIAYLDCSTGISGDMTVAALVDAGVPAAAICDGIAGLGLPGVRLEFHEVMRCAFRAKHLKILHPEQHAHRHLSDIVAILDRGRLTARQRQLAGSIFREIAHAEATVHGTTIDQIHFHEVGAIDSIVDIVAAAIGFDLLGVEQVVSSPVPTGRGQVRIAHGVCSVPTPGTAELLKGIPLVDVPIPCELTTPTGAAILKVVVDRFGPLPAMAIDKIGHGAGTREFPDRANMLRILVGELVDVPGGQLADEVLMLETNLDDVAGEVLGYARQRLMESGALDVIAIPAQMKKDRPAIQLQVVCRSTDAERLAAIIFRETETFGIRLSPRQRWIRRRATVDVQTPFGTVAVKLGQVAAGQVCTPEYEDCARLARQLDVPLIKVLRAAREAGESLSP